VYRRPAYYIGLTAQTSRLEGKGRFTFEGQAPQNTQPRTVTPPPPPVSVFEPSNNQLDGMERLFAYRNFVAEEWPHVLIWDLLVGRAIWIDGVGRGFPLWLLAPSITLTNLIGPPGALRRAHSSLSKGICLGNAIYLSIYLRARSIRVSRSCAIPPPPTCLSDECADARRALHLLLDRCYIR